MGAYHRVAHAHSSRARHDFLQAVRTVDQFVRACVPSIGEFVLLSLLWGFVLYLMLAATE